MDYFDSGFVYRDPAWHGLAEVLDDYPGSWQEARRLAGLDWEPVERPLFVPAARNFDTDRMSGDRTFLHAELADGWKAIERSDTGALLSIQRESYEVFPNRDLGPLIEALMDEPDVDYETAGSLKGGRKVWVMVRLREPFTIPGDPHGTTLSRLAIQNSHDASSALRAQRLQTRIVCDNTSHAADREAGRHGYEYQFRHTSSIWDRIEEAKAAINGLRSDRDRYGEWARELIGMRATPGARRRFVEAYVPMPPAGAVSDRVISNVHQARQAVEDILDGPTCEGIAETAYGLVQAGIEYALHGRDYRSQETHFRRTYLKRSKAARKAEEIAREVVTV